MQHILDVQLPEEKAAGAPGGDFQHIETDANMFGGFGAKALQQYGQGLESFGQGITKAGDTGIDIATQQAQQDARTHADELHSWHSDKVSDAQEKFLQLRGKDAEMQLPAFKQQIDDLHKQAREQAGNAYTARLVDSEGRRLTDAAYSQSARHAASQKTTWDTSTAIDGAATSGSRATIGATTTPDDIPINANASVVLSLARSDEFAKSAANLRGLDGDIEVQRNRGKNVAEIIKSTVADGSYTSFDRAKEFFHSQYDKIDPGSRATIEQSLKGMAASLDGQRFVDNATGHGAHLPPGYYGATVHIESGGQPGQVTGSNKGLAQFSPDLERRYGLNASNRDDPAAVARALSMENAENHDALARSLSHEPTPADYYLAHQQGAGGAVAHLSQPNLAAWQNMYGTVEGREKGQGWAKQAIWGNMTPQMKAQFPGGVDTVTSGDFARMWAQRFYNQPIEAVGTTPGTGTQLPGGVTPAAMGIDRLQSAQAFTQQSKGDLVKSIMESAYMRDRPQAMNAALSYANKVYESQSASYADMERQLHVQEQQKKLISEDAENNYLKQIYAPVANAKPIDMQSIVLDDRLSRESKDRLIKLVGAPGEKDQTTYGAGFVKAFQMVHAPEGTPGRITDARTLYDRLGENGDLTMAGVEKLRGEIDLKKSPEGAAEGEMKKEFLRNARGQITGSDEGLHIKDPKGDELYLKFMAQALPAYEAGRRDGKSPAQLLDPDSPDYVGKLIKTFKRPMDQWFNDTIHDATPAKAAAFDIGSVKSLDQLVTAYRAGNVTKAQADQMALSNGWAARKAVAPAAVVPVSQ